jgi:hypothetical protein
VKACLTIESEKDDYVHDKEQDEELKMCPQPDGTDEQKMCPHHKPDAETRTTCACTAKNNQNASSYGGDNAVSLAMAMTSGA